MVAYETHLVLGDRMELNKEGLEKYVTQLPLNEVSKQQLLTEAHMRFHLERIDKHVEFIARCCFVILLMFLATVITAAIFYLFVIR